LNALAVRAAEDLSYGSGNLAVSNGGKEAQRVKALLDSDQIYLFDNDRGKQGINRLIGHVYRLLS
jgi:hypothetical protein